MLFVRRNGDSMRAIDVRLHQAGSELAFDLCAIRAEADERDLVGGFREDVDEIVLRWRLLRQRRDRKHERRAKDERETCPDHSHGYSTLTTPDIKIGPRPRLRFLPLTND